MADVTLSEERSYLHVRTMVLLVRCWLIENCLLCAALKVTASVNLEHLTAECGCALPLRTVLENWPSRLRVSRTLPPLTAL